MQESRPKYSLEGIIATVVFAVMIAAVMLQVIGRAGLSDPPIWTEELSRWLWVWMAFLAIGEVERSDTHLKVELIASYLPERIHTVLLQIIDTAYLLVLIDLLWIGIEGVERASDSHAVTLPTTDAVLYASFPVAALFIIYRVVRRMVSRFHKSDVRTPS